MYTHGFISNVRLYCDVTPTCLQYFDFIYSVHFDCIKLFIRDTKTCTLDMYKYNDISFLHVSASLTPSSASSTPRFKSY